MKRILSFFVFFSVLILAISCGSAPVIDSEPPQPQPAPAVVAAPVVVETPPPAKEAAVFNPEAVSREKYNSTKIEVQQFIEKLNTIISNKNYEAWKASLSEDFFAEISSPVFLNEANEMGGMKSRGIILRTPRDYFNNVVVPSRANSRVDDIEFISENRVKAFTIMTNRSGQVQRLRLYDLEQSGDIWKIIN